MQGPVVKRIRPDAQYSYWLAAWGAASLLGLAPVSPALSLWGAAVFAAFQVAVARPRDPLLGALVVWMHLPVALLLPPPACGALEVGAQIAAFALFLLYLNAVGTSFARVQARNTAFYHEAAAADVVSAALSLGRGGCEGAAKFAYGYD